jgi:hypothetical protein
LFLEAIVDHPRLKRGFQFPVELLGFHSLLIAIVDGFVPTAFVDFQRPTHPTRHVYFL